MKKLFLGLVLVLVLSILTALNVYAAPLSPPIASGKCTGVKFKISWQEPSAPLSNLKNHTIYFTADEANILKKNYATSSPKGGKIKTAIVNIAMDCKLKNKIRIWVTSTNTLNEESEQSNILPLNTEWIEGTGL